MGPNKILCSNNSRLEGKSISNASVVISAVICFARQRDNMILLFYGNGTLVRDIYLPPVSSESLNIYSKGKGMESLSTANEDSREPV